MQNKEKEKTIENVKKFEGKQFDTNRNNGNRRNNVNEFKKAEQFFCWPLNYAVI